MSLEQELLYIAEGLREENVPHFFIQDLINAAERAGTLEWRLEDLEK